MGMQPWALSLPDNQAQDCVCVCLERTRTWPLHCEARGPTLPPQCTPGFSALCLASHLLPPAVLPSLLTSPQTPCDGRVLWVTTALSVDCMETDGMPFPSPGDRPKPGIEPSPPTQAEQSPLCLKQHCAFLEAPLCAQDCVCPPRVGNKEKRHLHPCVCLAEGFCARCPSNPQNQTQRAVWEGSGVEFAPFWL